MPHDHNHTSSSAASSDQEARRGTLIDETVTAHLLQIFGNQSQQYTPTQSQVDKILELQEKGMDYTHDERTHFSPKQWMNLGVLFITVSALLLVFLSCLFFAKEYLGEVVSGIVGLLAGSFGGYGLGSRPRVKSSDE